MTIMKLFEMIIIFKPKISDEIKRHIMTEYAPLFKEATDCIYFQDIGETKLAYSCKNYKVGYYVLIYFNSTPKWKTDKLEQKLDKDEEVLKYMIVPTDESEEKINKLCSRIDLSNPNKRIDAIDVLLGFTNYV